MAAFPAYVYEVMPIMSCYIFTSGMHEECKLAGSKIIILFLCLYVCASACTFDKRHIQLYSLLVAFKLRAQVTDGECSFVFPRQQRVVCMQLCFQGYL